MQIDAYYRDNDKTTFTTHHRVYGCLKMRFGVRSDLSMFQRAMDITMLTVNWQFALVHLDDVVIFPRSVAEPLTTYRQYLN